MAGKSGIEHRPLTELVTTRLRERIIYAEDARPGRRLVEAQLSEELGVSRIPVREALRQLAIEGIVTIEPRRGATVAAYTDAQKRQPTEVRAALEAATATPAARRRDACHIAELEVIVDEAGRLMRADAAGVPLEQNARFHDALGRASGNLLLREINVSLHQRTLLLFGAHCVARAGQIWREHGDIFKAVSEGDEELAALLATRHVQAARLFQ